MYLQGKFLESNTAGSKESACAVLTDAVKFPFQRVVPVFIPPKMKVTISSQPCQRMCFIFLIFNNLVG